MTHHKLTILGCGSAQPHTNAFHSAQVLCMRDHQYMIDCGEGAQLRISQYRVRTARLNNIFISHLHGDHCFGILPLISTMGLQGRTADIVIHSHPDLQKILEPQINYFLSEMPFKVLFEPFSPYKSACIYEDKIVRVTTFPLVHRVPTVGFIFEEKEGARHLNAKLLNDYNIPISQRPLIKNGADYVTPEGEVIPNAELTLPPDRPSKYVYMSDTAYSEKYLYLAEGADLLYHESTFLTDDAQRIAQTMHSSAAQAAEFAKKAAVKRLLLGHYSSRQHNHTLYQDEARTIFANSTACNDGDVFEF